MTPTPIVPGRGLNSYSAIEERHKYLEKHGHSIAEIRNHGLEIREIQKNIESFIGSVEIPLGVVGPLLYQDSGKEGEWVYCAAGTLEGALIASMNRGAKAISQSGGFRAQVIHQRMVRAPMFIFDNIEEAGIFKDWVGKHFSKIKTQAENHSNHANLLMIDPYVTGGTVHLKFIYETGDASGQNMTTTCTWHALLWINEQFQKESKIPILQCVIEGNGSSDKKVSQYAIQQGRGVHVISECFISDEVLQRILRTTADAIVACFHPSQVLARLDGMVGYNINVANAIAAIFVATGQDLGSVHESSVGILNVGKRPGGLYLSLTLPSLVIGAIGGGTHISKQKEALALMDCYGNGKIERFASLIAGFALGLEISTYSAIVSGEFAKAHEKLGRNKPINWLTRGEIDLPLLRRCLSKYLGNNTLQSMRIIGDGIVDNGVITTLTSRVSNKLIGFIPIKASYIKNGAIESLSLILKSKALDLEVIKGLHLMAASIDPHLSDLLNRYRNQLEYTGSHQKEIAIYEQLHQAGFDCTPAFYGKYINERREIYLFAQELLAEEDLIHIDSQKQPELWTSTQIQAVLKAITEIHQHFGKVSPPKFVKPFQPWKALPLYQKFIELMQKETKDDNLKSELEHLQSYLGELEEEYLTLILPKTLVHNDFNSRNIAMRTDGRPCIYDWELAVIDIPHRDVVEFLSFVLPLDFEEKNFLNYLKFHFQLYQTIKEKWTWEAWVAGYIYAIKVYLITRVSFYEVAGILDRYSFSDRILRNALRMLHILSPSDEQPPHSQ